MTTEAKEQRQIETVIADFEDDDESYWGDAYRLAAHMLHEQAHGSRTAWRFCPEQPCRDLPDRSIGPAPSTSIGLF